MNKKLGKKDRVKIKLRWLQKYNEFITKDKEELRKLYNETKMSSTDKHALTQAVQDILYKESQEIKTDDKEIKQEEIQESSEEVSTEAGAEGEIKAEDKEVGENDSIGN